MIFVPIEAYPLDAYVSYLSAKKAARGATKQEEEVKGL